MLFIDWQAFAVFPALRIKAEALMLDKLAFL
jgi:hypothetical protein